MKNLLFAALLFPVLAMGQDLAVFAIEAKIDGMTLPDEKPGVGDRSYGFQLVIDPEDLEVANTVWYEHLKLLFGTDDVEQLRTWAEEVTQRR